MATFFCLIYLQILFCFTDLKYVFRGVNRNLITVNLLLTDKKKIFFSVQADKGEIKYKFSLLDLKKCNVGGEG